jgi:hypothetical protein
MGYFWLCDGGQDIHYHGYRRVLERNFQCFEWNHALFAAQR